jgi:hypothetical protein
LKLFTIPEGDCGPFRDLEPLRPLQELEFLCLPAGTVEEQANVDALYGLSKLNALFIDEAAGVDTHRFPPGCSVAVCPNPIALRRRGRTDAQQRRATESHQKARIYYPSHDNQLETAILVASVAEAEQAWGTNLADYEIEGLQKTDTILITLG